MKAVLDASINWQQKMKSMSHLLWSHVCFRKCRIPAIFKFSGNATSSHTVKHRIHYMIQCDAQTPGEKPLISYLIFIDCIIQRLCKEWLLTELCSQWLNCVTQDVRSGLDGVYKYCFELMLFFKFWTFSNIRVALNDLLPTSLSWLLPFKVAVASMLANTCLFTQSAESEQH